MLQLPYDCYEGNLVEETTKLMLQMFFSALDRFAQFFIAPLMKKNAMEREREAVDSEFEQALPSDYNRRQQGTT